MYYVYILFSQLDRQLYTGFTPDLRSRLNAHKNGYVRSTKHRRPLILIHYEAYTNESDAKMHEKYLKSGKGRGELKIQLKRTFVEVGYKNL